MPRKVEPEKFFENIQKNKVKSTTIQIKANNKTKKLSIPKWTKERRRLVECDQCNEMVDKTAIRVSSTAVPMFYCPSCWETHE